MLIGTFFTLFVVPAIYQLLAASHSAIEDDEEDEPIVAEKRMRPVPQTSPLITTA